MKSFSAYVYTRSSLKVVTKGLDTSVLVASVFSHLEGIQSGGGEVTSARTHSALRLRLSGNFERRYISSRIIIIHRTANEILYRVLKNTDDGDSRYRSPPPIVDDISLKIATRLCAR